MPFIIERDSDRPFPEPFATMELAAGAFGSFLADEAHDARESDDDAAAEAIVRLHEDFRAFYRPTLLGFEGGAGQFTYRIREV